MKKSSMNEKLVEVQGNKVWIKNILPDDVAPFDLSEQEYEDLVKRGCSFEKNDCLGKKLNLRGLWVSDCEKVDTSGKNAYGENSDIRRILDKVDIAKLSLDASKDASDQYVVESTGEAKGIELYYEVALAACESMRQYLNSSDIFFAPPTAFDREKKNREDAINIFIENLKKEIILVQNEYLCKALDSDSFYGDKKKECLSMLVGNILNETSVEPIDEELKQKITEEIKKYSIILERTKRINEDPAGFFAPAGAIDYMQGEYDKDLSSLQNMLVLLTVGQLKYLYESCQQSDECVRQAIQIAIVIQYRATNCKNEKTSELR